MLGGHLMMRLMLAHHFGRTCGRGGGRRRRQGRKGKSHKTENGEEHPH
jgi:hypothetical protein